MKHTNFSLNTMKIILALGVFFGNVNFIMAQNYINNYGWIKVESPEYESSKDVEGFTKNSSFNEFLESINVIKYQKALPFAKSPELLKYYEIECECDLDEFENYIEENSISALTDFNKDIALDEAIVHDVSDYMWWLHHNDPNNDHMWYLKIIEADKAWNITTGDTTVTVAVLDTKVDITHPDLASEILLPYDPLTLTPHTCINAANGWDTHGSGVASMVSAETAPTGQTAAGQLPSIGYNTKMYFYYSSEPAPGASGYLGFLRKCLHASNVMGVRALVSCASNGIGCSVPPFNPQPIIKEILDNGTSIIVPAGNAYSGFNCGTDANPLPLYPLHPSYDDRLIIVSSTGKDDRHYQAINGVQRTHSRFPEVDVCAPGFDLSVAIPVGCTNPSPFPYYGYAAGTSFASPLVAGIVSLMYSINPCLSTTDVKAILKNTTDPIVDAASYPGLVGTGRVNAYKAVQQAQAVKSATVDLYIKDRVEDVGISGGYHWQAARDDSPDIWVRNQNDGRTNQVNQDPEYQSSTPVYVYVKVRNKSCDTSTVNEVLKLYWSKASSWSSWPQNWDGSSPFIGDEIGNIAVDGLLPGKDTIVEFAWNILNPNIHNNWATCLLARIENSNIDPITVYPGRIDDDVYFNNNIAMKNITIIDNLAGAPPGPIFDHVYTSSRGRYLFIGATDEENTTFDIQFSENESEFSISEEAELKVYVDNEGWELLLPYVADTEGIEPFNEEERSFLITQPNVLLQSVNFPEGNRIPIYLGFNFLTDEAENDFYTYKVQQYFPESNQPLGGVYFDIYRPANIEFYADAGEDQIITLGKSSALTAKSIEEPAIYKWYNSQGKLVHEGLETTVTPSETETYRLEVISQTDGHKDYDEVEIKVIKSWINSINPNPASDLITLSYTLDDAVTNASVIIRNSAGVSQNTHALDVNREEAILDVSNLPSGIYNVSLVTDNEIMDIKLLTIY